MKNVIRNSFDLCFLQTCFSSEQSLWIIKNVSKVSNNFIKNLKIEYTNYFHTSHDSLRLSNYLQNIPGKLRGKF